jgi:dihydroxyacetone kinase phosphoprotein-dependent L subunit
MTGFTNSDGARIVPDLVEAVRENAQLLSDIDGAIGDGDHGVNMKKGFGLAGAELAKGAGDLTHGLKVLSRTLMDSIGGAMGPLYGMFFRGLAKGCAGKQLIDAATFGQMLQAAGEALRTLSQAEVGDKTLMDAFLPAEQAYGQALSAGGSFAECLEVMVKAAERGRDSTRDLIAKVGRASRLGERSRGTQDAGATSCALLLRTMSESIKSLLQNQQKG